MKARTNDKDMKERKGELILHLCTWVSSTDKSYKTRKTFHEKHTCNMIKI